MVYPDKAIRIILGLTIILITAVLYFIVFPGPIEAHSNIMVYVGTLIVGIIVLLSAFFPTN